MNVPVPECTPLVTIGVPVLNGYPYIIDAIQDLLQQTHSNLEILIFDNASTDGTREYLESIAASDSRISLRLRSETVSGLQNFHDLLQSASGNYFMWHAHDDRRDAHAIEALLSALRSDDSFSLAFSHYELRDLHTGDTTRVKSFATYFRHTWQNYLVQLFWDNPCAIYGLHRTDALKAVSFGAFDFADVHVIHTYAIEGRIVIVPEFLFTSGTLGVRTPRAADGRKLRGQDFRKAELSLLNSHLTGVPKALCVALLRLSLRRNLVRLNRALANAKKN
jgi:glycosyltransferase involved in cell wall biosynthesis